MVDDESIFDVSPALRKLKKEYIAVDTEGMLNDTVENSAYIYKLLKSQDPEKRLQFIHHLKNNYEGNFFCLMKELIHRDSMLSNENKINTLKKQLNEGKITLDEYKTQMKSIIRD